MYHLWHTICKQRPLVYTDKVEVLNNKHVLLCQHKLTLLLCIWGQF